MLKNNELELTFTIQKNGEKGFEVYCGELEFGVEEKTFIKAMNEILEGISDDWKIIEKCEDEIPQPLKKYKDLYEWLMIL